MTRRRFPGWRGCCRSTTRPFPTGGYAHSYGLSKSCGSARPRCGIDAPASQKSSLADVDSLRTSGCPPRAGGGSGNDLAALVELDAIVDATKTPRELREASRATGRRRLHAFAETGLSPALAALARAIEDGRCQGHHAVVYGAGQAAVPPRALLASWAFQSLSAVCLSAPKLLRIGQDGAQRVLTASPRRHGREYHRIAHRFPR